MTWRIVFWWEVVLAGTCFVIITVRAIGMCFAVKKDHKGGIEVHTEGKKAKRLDA
jgi:hypothetical protein